MNGILEGWKEGKEEVKHAAGLFERMEGWMNGRMKLRLEGCENGSKIRED
jgi:hypothetical protein